MPPSASPPPQERESSPAPPSNPQEDFISKDGDETIEKKDADTEKSDAPASAADDAPPLPDEAVPNDPPLPAEPVPDGPPLPQEAPPQAEDDGWDCQWDPTSQSWFFYNRLTGKSQWENPRVPSSSAAPTSSAIPPAPGTVAEPSGPRPPTSEQPAAGGYNPAIHGDYDPNAWYAQGYNNEEEAEAAAAGVDSHTAAADPYGTTAQFNRFTGQFQTEEMGAGRHTDEAKSKRQMNAFFDVDAAANAHDGRSLKAERSNKKPSKSELKAFKEKRRARKEEKRRAWLRD